MVPPYPVAAGEAVTSARPVQYGELAFVLAALDRSGASPHLDLPEAHERLARVLGDFARSDPFAHPELFPSENDVLAWLVNAHVAWVVALNNSPGLTSRDPVRLREVPFPLAGGQWTLGHLEREVRSRAKAEPRLVLFLNPGFRNGPPLPETALEGHALAWQIAEHAARCGRAPGFWSFDPARRELRVSEYAGYLPGLPAAPARRARRLLDLVPPPTALREEVLAACGEALQRCSVQPDPLDRRDGPKTAETSP